MSLRSRFGPDIVRLSPFFSRAYGGYSSKQEAFLRSHLVAPKASIFDPMAGQAVTLGDLAAEGAAVWACDLNPAVLLLALLRSPEVIARRRRLVRFADNILSVLPRNVGPARPLEFVDNWVADEISSQLIQLRAHLGKRASANPFSSDGLFWTAPLETRFITAIAVLAARSLACYQSTDNITWLKRGGVNRALDLCGPMSLALRAWDQFATMREATAKTGGSLQVSMHDAAASSFDEIPKVSMLVTSPPYANRLDYSRMWAPELEILAAMWETSTEHIKRRQVGSTVVRNAAAPRFEFELPRTVRAALNAIRDDAAAKASESYYYPFFRNYAFSLGETLSSAAVRIKREGVAVIFVRDTMRKDVLFPTGDLVRSCLRTAGFRIKIVHKEVIREHIGMRRRSSTAAVYGLAQQEWWMAFARS